MESLISDYGYLAVLCGTFLEGETVLVLGGLAVHRGFLELRWVMFLAFLGTLAGDQLYYYLGRTRGAALLAARPTWKTKAARVFRLLESHETMVILGFRFFYGVRTVVPGCHFGSLRAGRWCACNQKECSDVVHWTSRSNPER